MMASTPLSHMNTGTSRLTSSNLQLPRVARSPNSHRNYYDAGLSLQKIIGTTVTSPTAFDSLASLRIFAYTAGAAVIVVNIDGLSDYSQRFFRARPTFVSLGHNSSLTLTAASNDGRNRSIGSHRDPTVSYSLCSYTTAFESGDSSTSKASNTREKIKAAACLSLSRNGKFLAVGETGHAPRVLIFSLQDNSSSNPAIILNEHTYGVHAVTFSPDSKHLASLGVTNDGFLYIWAINHKTGSAKLQSTNKCTSFVKQMLWLGNNSLVTIGTRHIKIWRTNDHRNCTSPTKQKGNFDSAVTLAPAQSLPKTLAGRNVLLGPLVEATFAAIVAISDFQAIVCSEKGDICLLDDSNGPKLHKLVNVGFSTICLAVDMETRRLAIGGKNGKKFSFFLDDLLSPNTPPNSPTAAQPLSLTDCGHICAMGYAGKCLITVDSNHVVEVSHLDSHTSDSKPLHKPFPAHGDAVLGVRALSENSMKADFITWSANGVVVFWDSNGTKKYSLKVDLEQLPTADVESVNQCSNLCVSNGSRFLAYGDRFGVLRVVEPLRQKLLFETRAHSTDINSIALHEDTDLCLLATCGRDRMIQLFRHTPDEWTLIQTLDDHTASVTDIFFVDKGEKLVSSSTDRTVHIRQVVKQITDGRKSLVVLPLRIITLRASPVSMAPSFDHRSEIMVSLHDRTVAKYEISTGRLLMSFKASDNDGIDAVSLDSIKVGMSHPNSPRTILAGVSSTDKSVRVYDGSTGALIDREWGHSSNVTGVALLERPNSEYKTMISTGSDGTIMIWSLSSKSSDINDSTEFQLYTENSATPKETSITRAPLRRVLSKAELAEFQRITPASTPTGRRSPPRASRKKVSKYGVLTQTTSQLPVSTAPKAFSSASDDFSVCRAKTRARSRSPATSPKTKDSRRQSMISPAEIKGRSKNSAIFSEFGSLNLATEQACQTLRAYRKKLLSSEPIKESFQKKLDHELRLTALALGEKSQKARTINETVMTGLLDEYSERLVSLFDEKLKATRLASIDHGNENSEKPQRVGSSPV